MRFAFTAGLMLGSLCGLLQGHGSALAATLDKEACAALKAEEAQLVAAGVRDDMQRGPEWAKVNLTPERMQQIARLIEIGEGLSFRCRTIVAPTVRAKAAAAKADEGKGPAAAANAQEANAAPQGAAAVKKKAAAAAEPAAAAAQAPEASTPRPPPAAVRIKPAPRRKPPVQAKVKTLPAQKPGLIDF